MMNPDCAGNSAPTTDSEVGEGRSKPVGGRGTPGAGLTRCATGKALPEMPVLKPYWGKLAVRNFRGGDGNIGIIRSPIRAIALPDWPRFGGVTRGLVRVSQCVGWVLGGRPACCAAGKKARRGGGRRGRRKSTAARKARRRARMARSMGLKFRWQRKHLPRFSRGCMGQGTLRLSL